MNTLVIDASIAVKWVVAEDGTSRMRASVCAIKVLPVPVGPISRIFDFASSISEFRILFMWMRFEWL